LKGANYVTDEKRKRIRVFLVDDHPTVREGVRSYLAGRAVTVVGEASSAREALRKVGKLSPDIVILDVNLPFMDGGELALRLRRLVPACGLIAFSIHSGEEYVARMARCGVRGYVTKDQPLSDLLDAINQVFRGGSRFPRGMEAVLRSSPGQPGGAALTCREVEVLTLLADGLSNKGVAAKLGIGTRTAETHREHLSHKLNILTVAGLTKYALQHGLTSLK